MDTRALQTEVEAAIARWQVPGAAVGILLDGEEHYAFAGVTSVEDPLPVDHGTLFQPGSIGKTFTATAIMRLVEEGRVDLHAPVRTYVPELVLADESVAADVTVLQLLNHTAGWTGDRMDDTGEGDDALARFVELMRELPQVSPLGEVVSYNNAAVLLAGRLIERLTGMVYEHAIERMLLEPLGLSASLFFPNDIMTHRFAAGHRSGPDGKPVVARPWKMPRVANAAGGVATTARDLIAWARFHMGDGRSDAGEQVLSPESVALMQQTTKEMRGSALGDEVGIAWLMRDVDGVRLVGHGGTTLGHNAQLTFVPERGFAVVVLGNCTPSSAQLCDELARWTLGAYAGVDDSEPEPIAADAATLARYAGRYESTSSISQVRVEDGQLVLRMAMKPEELARLAAAGEAPPPEPPPATLGLLPGGGHQWVMTSGPAKGMKGYFASELSGEIVGMHAGGRMATRIADESRDGRPG